MDALQDKTILITGASRGIGAATARLCAEKGARLILHASGESEAMAGLAQDLGLGLDQVLLEDLAAPGAGARLVARALEGGRALDGVVNNAGIYLETALIGDAAAWDENWAATMAVNVKAPADICRAAIAHFRERGGGRIINVASRAAYRGDGPDFAAYAASKAALNAMTKTWARGLSGENILFYAIAPGWVETRMAPRDIEARKAAVKDIPLGRVADPKEVGAMIAFLLSDACVSATGSTFDINGASYVR
ncbi:MAG: SDR family oxidoreductase [Pseudomonadota bacterium]